jgi:thioredoxin 1
MSSNYKKYADLVEADKPKYPELLDLESTEQKKDLVSKFPGVVVDVYGDFCMPCKSIAPRFAKLAEEYKQYGFVFAKENVEKKISQNIKGVPTFQYFYNGAYIDSTVGADMTEVKNKIDEMVKMHVNKVQIPPNARPQIQPMNQPPQPMNQPPQMQQMNQPPQMQQMNQLTNQPIRQIPSAHQMNQPPLQPLNPMQRPINPQMGKTPINQIHRGI